MNAAIRMKKPTVIRTPRTNSSRPAPQNGHAPTSAYRSERRARRAHQVSSPCRTCLTADFRGVTDIRRREPVPGDLQVDGCRQARGRNWQRSESSCLRVRRSIAKISLVTRVQFDSLSPWRQPICDELFVHRLPAPSATTIRLVVNSIPGSGNCLVGRCPVVSAGEPLSSLEVPVQVGSTSQPIQSSHPSLVAGGKHPEQRK